MKKLQSSLKNMVLVLVGFSLAIGALLAYVNHITEGPIKAKAEQTLAAGIKVVMKNDNIKVDAPEDVTENINGKEVNFTVHNTKDQNGKFIGSAIESSSNGFGGNLKVLVGFNPDGQILGYTILESSETPGLGAKADKWFQKDGKGSIIGLNPKTGDLHVSKDDKTGNAVDAITASTITSRAFLKAIDQAYAVYAKKGSDAESGATKCVK
nr:RnfABCDGE type electron transport complex subunit G [Prevotella sp.]